MELAVHLQNATSSCWDYWIGRSARQASPCKLRAEDGARPGNSHRAKVGKFWKSWRTFSQVENIEFLCKVPQPIKRVYVPSSHQYHTTIQFGFMLRFSLVPSSEGLYFYMFVTCPNDVYRCHRQGDGQIRISRLYCQGGWELLVDISTSQPSTFTIICFSLSRQYKSQFSSPFSSSPLPPSFSTISFVYKKSLFTRISTQTIATMFAQIFSGAFVAVLAAQCSRFPLQFVVSKAYHSFCLQLLLRVAPGLTPSKKETTVTKFPWPTTPRRKCDVQYFRKASMTLTQVPTRCCQPEHRPWMR